MIPETLRIVLLAGLVCYFVLILLFLKDKALTLKYTLLWLLAGGVMLIMILFPRTLFIVTKLLGIQSSMNGLYLICIGFIIVILMAITSIVSRQRNKIKILTQEFAILEERIRELEKNEKG